MTQTIIDMPNETEQVAVGVCTRVPVNTIRFVKELYPRLHEDNAAIERYRAAIEHLPPIVIARDGILVDGFHRWQAHIREDCTDIAAINLGNLADAEIVRESISRNASHGQQLSNADKQRLAGILWRNFGAMTPAERVSEIASLLSVTPQSVRTWTKDARAAEKAELQAKAWDLWLNCCTQQQIAEEMGRYSVNPTIQRETSVQFCGRKRTPPCVKKRLALALEEPRKHGEEEKKREKRPQNCTEGLSVRS